MRSGRPIVMRVLRFIGKALLLLCLVIFLLIVAIRLPFVQEIITGRIEDFLREKMQTGITLNRIYLDYGGNVAIKELMVPDQVGDTLLHLGELALSIRYLPLLKKQIRPRLLSLENVQTDVHPFSDGTMNYQYLIDAFRGDEETGSSRETAPSRSRPGWTFDLSGTHLSLEDIHARYLSSPDSILYMDYSVGAIDTRVRTGDPAKGVIDLKDLLVSETYTVFNMKDSETEPDNTSSPLKWNITADEIRFKNVGYDMTMPDLVLGTFIGSLSVDDSSLDLLGDTMRFEVRKFELGDSRYKMEFPESPASPGFDYAHMDLDNINIIAKDLTYDNLDIYGVIEQITANDKCGVELTGFEARVHFCMDSVAVYDVSMKTPASSIDIPFGRITLPIDEGSTLDEMEISFDIDPSLVLIEDIGYFVPDLYKMDYWPSKRKELLTLEGQVRGTLGNLNITRLLLSQGVNTIDISGTVEHVTDVDHLSTDLKLNQVKVSGRDVEMFLPANTLPGDATLPSVMTMAGTVNGTMDLMRFNLDTRTYRNAPSGHIRMHGVARNLLDMDHLFIDTTIDTLWLTNNEISTWLPDTLRTQLKLPDAVAFAGYVSGGMDTAFADLRGSVRRGDHHSIIDFYGHIDSLSNPAALKYDVQIREFIVSREEMLAWIPEGALPAYVRLPEISHTDGSITGSSDSIKAVVSIQTTSGSIGVDLDLRDSVYKGYIGIDSLIVQSLFVDSTAYDSVIGWPAPPIDLELIVDGSGFAIDSNLLADVQLRLRLQGDSIYWEEGLAIDGKFDKRSFSGHLSINEDQANLDLDVYGRMDNEYDTVSIAGNINRLFLDQLRLFPKQFDFRSRFSMQGTYADSEHFSIDLNASDVYARYDTIYEYTDTLALIARRNIDENVLQLNIESDFVKLAMYDKEHHPEKFNSGIQQLVDELDMDVSALQLNKDSSQNVFFDLEIIRPGVFTSGFIPGLTELSPIALIGALDLQDTSFAVSGLIPHLRYQSYKIDSTQIAGGSWNKMLFGAVNIGSAELFGAVNIEDMVLLGTMHGTDTTTFLMMQTDSINNPDTSQNIRTLIVVSMIRQDTAIIFHLARAPVINFDTSWHIDTSNRIVLKPDNIEVYNFALQNGDQVIRGSEVNNNTLRLNIDNLDLDMISNSIKWQSEYAHGHLNGEVDITNPLGEMSIKSDLRATGLGSREAEIGDLTITAEMDSIGNWVFQTVLDGNNNNANIQGKYGGEDGSVEGIIQANLSNVPAFVQFIPETIDSAGGSVNVDLTLDGTTDNPKLNGFVELINLYIKPAATGASWLIPSARLNFSPERIALSEPMTILDSLGTKGTMNLELIPHSLSDFELIGSFKAKNFLLLQIPENEEDLYSGTVYSDIEVEISGSTAKTILINGSVTTREGSYLVYLYDTGDELQAIETGNGIIEFVDFYALDSLELYSAHTTPVKKSTDYTVNLTATVNHDLDLKVIMDKHNGDHLTGQGEGTLSLRLAPGADIEASGQIDVSGSKYLFTYEGLIKREFELKDESTLTFAGPVDNPTLDLSAQYNVKTSPELLVKLYGSTSESDEERLKRRQEFVVNIHASGMLDEADISADIEYPDVTGNSIPDLVDPALAKLRANPSDMNTQAFSLIILNGFSLGGSTNASIVNVSQGVSDVVSSQLNTFAAKYVNFVELDFGIENLSESSLSFEDTDFRVGVKKRFLDNRLIVEIDGVASTRSGSGSDMASVLENVSVEYVLNKNRSLRLKAFNTYETDEIIAGSVLKIGVALLISRDFDKWTFKKQSRKEEENTDNEESGQ